MTEIIDATQTIQERQEINLEFGLTLYLQYREENPLMAEFILKQLGITEKEANEHPLVKSHVPSCTPTVADVLSQMDLPFFK